MSAPDPTTPAVTGPLARLTGTDLELLARADAAGRAAGPDPAGLARSPDRVEALLTDQRVFDTVFGPPESAPTDPLVGASPFLVFAVAVYRAAPELAATGYVHEWIGPRQRIPVFDAGELSAFLADRDHRFFLADLLASYTRVASGVMWAPTRRGPRRQRFSELDPTRLAALLAIAPEGDHPTIYRRLGDLALFLTGVFPDHTGAHGLSAVDAERLVRTLPGDTTPDEVVDALSTRGSVGLLGVLGARWYRLAAEGDAAPTTSTTVADRFVDARRVLNHVTDRHLFPFRGHWFPVG